MLQNEWMGATSKKSDRLLVTWSVNNKLYNNKRKYRMNRKKEIIAIVTLVMICCAIMAVVDGVIQPNYAIKSTIKIILFLMCPFAYSLIDRETKLKSLFQWKKKGAKLTLLLAGGVYIVIVGAYFITKEFFDFSRITGVLSSNIGVTGDRFVWVALYISFINSLLEEFFFRGFAFLTIKKLTSRKFAYLFSTSSFAFYHVAMMIGWFSLEVFLLTLIGLFAGGIIFNYLNEKNETIYSSWMVHMSANFAINTVGFILFGII